MDNRILKVGDYIQIVNAKKYSLAKNGAVGKITEILKSHYHGGLKYAVDSDRKLYWLDIDIKSISEKEYLIERIKRGE